MTESSPATEAIPVDFTQLKKMVGDNRVLFRKLGDQALQEYPAMFARMLQAVQQGDAQGLERLAHTLKGSVANLGAEAPRRLAYSLELLGKSGDTAAAAAILFELEKELERLYAFFTSPLWIEKI